MSLQEMPEGARLVHAFVNSLDLRAFKRRGEVHERIDELDSPDSLTAWLRAQQLIDGADRARPEDLAEALKLRARLRAAMGDTPEGDAVQDPLAWPVSVTVEAGRPPSLTPVGSGVRAALGHVVLAAMSAVRDGTWDRLKVCPADDCRWVFYDRTKPGRGRWCDPELCGNRMKTRAYRERRKKAGASAEDAASTSR